MTTDVENVAASEQPEPTPVSMALRSSAEIIAELTATRDTKRIRELSTELQDSVRREAQREVDERNEAIRARINPLRDSFVRAIERDADVAAFIREHGGVLNFSYSVPAEGSEQGPLVTILISDSVKAASAPRAPRAPSSNGSTGRGHTYVIAGTEYSLAGAFDVLATAEDKEDLVKRMASAGTDKSKNSAAWAVKSRTVNKAVTDNRASIKD